MTERRSALEDVGDRLRRLRGDMTVGEFAAELGMAVEDYIAYETGKREISTSLLIALIDRGAIDPMWVLTGRRAGSAADSAKIAGIAYSAILEAAQRAGVMLPPSGLAYAVRAAWQGISRGRKIGAAHADVLVKLATINADRLP
jgi:hypothetical protein